jgi:hypothetical protein
VQSKTNLVGEDKRIDVQLTPIGSEVCPSSLCASGMWVVIVVVVIVVVIVVVVIVVIIVVVVIVVVIVCLLW